MKFICLTNPNEKPNRHAAAKEHFTSIGIEPIYLNCLHSPIAGLKTTHDYGKFNTKRINGTQVGCFLAHYMVWNAAWATGEDMVCIIENDAKFCHMWDARLKMAVDQAPDEWDIIRLGHLGTDMDTALRINHDLYVCQDSFSTVAYIVRRKALPILLETNRKVYAPIDHALIERSYPKLNVYTVNPPIVVQCNERWQMDISNLQEAT